MGIYCLSRHHTMRVAKLSTGPIVQLLKTGPVMFAEGTWALVLPRLERPLAHRNDPYWVPTSSVVWVLELDHLTGAHKGAEFRG